MTGLFQGLHDVIRRIRITSGHRTVSNLVKRTIWFTHKNPPLVVNHRQTFPGQLNDTD